MSRFPHTWLRRAVWLMLAISAGWVAYKFGSAYSACRTHGTEKVGCVGTAVASAYTDIWLLISTTVVKLLTFVLP
jgi:hypothetical protein